MSIAERLRAQEKAATPGPWRSAWDEPIAKTGRDDTGETWLIAGPGDPFADGFVFGCLYNNGPLAAGNKQNAALAVALRNASPRLIAAMAVVEKMAHSRRCFAEGMGRSDEDVNEEDEAIANFYSLADAWALEDFHASK